LVVMSFIKEREESMISLEIAFFSSIVITTFFLTSKYPTNNLYFLE
jgi:hypothetical protein